jgi:hypothetical protein
VKICGYLGFLPGSIFLRSVDYNLSFHPPDIVLITFIYLLGKYPAGEQTGYSKDEAEKGAHGKNLRKITGIIRWVPVLYADNISSLDEDKKITGRLRRVRFDHLFFLLFVSV